MHLVKAKGHKLEKAIIRNGGITTDIEWLCTGGNFEQVMLLARGEAELTRKAKPAPKEELPLNAIIHVDRVVLPVYPDWMEKVIHPELEAHGPAQYDLANVELWLHEGQKNGKWTQGSNIYAHLKENGMLESCLSLRDGEEIKKNGIVAFRKFFGGKAVFLWKSVVQRCIGRLWVPYICDDGDEVVVYWDRLDRDWDGNDPRGSSRKLVLCPSAIELR